MPDEEDDSVFNYFDTAETKEGIVAANRKLEGPKIAIVGADRRDPPRELCSSLHPETGFEEMARLPIYMPRTWGTPGEQLKEIAW